MEEKNYKLCPKCGFFCHMNEPDKYCSRCGSLLLEECPSCGQEISNPYAKYCKLCGKIYPGRKEPEGRIRF